VRATTAIIVLEVAGGSLLAFRWPTPIGNLTISRLGAIAAVGYLIGATRGRVIRQWSKMYASAFAVICTMAIGLLYSPNLPIGVSQVQNSVEAVVILVATALLVKNVLGPYPSPLSIKSIAKAPILGFLPSGLLGIFQATQLYRGQVPTIPLISLSRLTDASTNSSRTAFNSGLNEFGLDRIAGATGDPSTFGIFCAMTLLYILWLRRNAWVEKSLFLYLACVLSLAGVLLSASGSALLVLVSGLAFFVPRNASAWFRSPKRLLQLAIPLAVGWVTVPGLQQFFASAQSRISLLIGGQGTAGVHVSLVGYGWSLFLDNLFFGVGAAGLSFHQLGYSVDYSSVHNVLILRLAEGGIVGGLALVWFWVTLGTGVVPKALLIPSIAGWMLYLDFNRLPAIWAILAVSAALLHTQRARAG
jgi:hypothetical protein